MLAQVGHQTRGYTGLRGLAAAGCLINAGQPLDRIHHGTVEDQHHLVVVGPAPLRDLLGQRRVGNGDGGADVQGHPVVVDLDVSHGDPFAYVDTGVSCHIDERSVELDLTADEKKAFEHSSGAVRKTCDEVDEMLKNLADQAFEAEGFRWDTI